MPSQPPLRLYMLTGEASGDALGANILKAYNNMDIAYELGGLAGPKMQAMGATSLFDISRLSLMGFTEVIARLPSILKLVNQTVDDALAFDPDIVVLIDSPDFNYAVAKRLKKKNPKVKIIKYICPSVWAWRQGRAKKMAAYIDHVLAILPFEPELMEKLGGPPTTFVGHPLSAELEKFGYKDRAIPSNPVKLLVLPGSRMGEATRLLPIIRETLEIMQERGVNFEATLPAVDNLKELLRDEIQTWPVKPKIVVGHEAKNQAFETADVALACSGTVMLELGLFGIPTVSIYKLDKLGFIVKKLAKVWTGCLPNLITDKVIIPERFDYYCYPQLLAREMENLCVESPNRNAQIDGFKLLRKMMKRDQNQQGLAAKIILQVAGYSKVA